MKEKRKTIFKYVLGILSLAASVILAWFLPGWYSSWNDTRLMRQVTLSSRENIDFLDIDSLDIADRLNMLQNSENFGWDVGLWDGAYFFSGITEDTLFEKSKALIGDWCVSGLLPRQYHNWVKDLYPRFFTSSNLYLDQAILPVCMVNFVDERQNALFIVMDIEKDLIYYASATGPWIEEEMALSLGYASYADMSTRLSKGESLPGCQPDTSGYDFASVCGADTASISSSPDCLELSVVLSFDTFHGSAFRKVICNGSAFGLAIMYGTERWSDFVTEICLKLGIEEYAEDTMFWLSSLGADVFKEQSDLSELES